MKIKIMTHDNYFGQSLPTFKSMNLNLLKNEFEKENFDVEFIEFEKIQHEVLNEDSQKENIFYLCGSHQNEDIKSYLDDIIDSKFFDGKLIPSRRLIKAHDNKGYQGLLASELKLNYVHQEYFIEITEIKEKKVIKTTNGAGSGGVSLCENESTLKKFIFNNKMRRIGLKRAAYVLRALYRNFRKKEWSEEMVKYYQPKVKYVTQEFIDGLNCDYKILVFMDQLFVLERETRKGDFRASGSGIFKFIKPNENLLNFALECREILNTPYVSLDIISKDDVEYQCIEYQCVHFGPYTQMNADKFYKKINGRWKSFDNDTVLEELIVKSVVNFLRL